MSKRSIELSLRLEDFVATIISFLMLGGTVVMATPLNLDQVNKSVEVVLGAAQEMLDRLSSDKTKHMVDKESRFGWKFVSSLEFLEGKIWPHGSVCFNQFV